MKGSWKWVSGIVVIAAMAFAMIATGLKATPSAALRFKLPFDAQMQKLSLSAGEYSLVLDRSHSGGEIFIYQGQQSVGILFPQTFDEREDQGQKSALICLRHDGKVAVRALRLPNVGTYYFSLPKDLKTLTAEQPQLIETISVEANGN
jgi:hypothetical protein